MGWDAGRVVTYKLSLNTSAIIISHMSYAVACFLLNTSNEHFVRGMLAL